ncbi:MAG: sugar phosphate isomerase/epimerase [Nitrospirae bacterium]|nr:sugar phosphate isomerase/epimerase [Nitrospirota bacterium]
MKKGISQWAFPASMKLAECMKQAEEAGFEGIEVALAEEGEINLKSTKDDLEKIVASSKEIGIEITSLATGLFWDYSLTSDDLQVRDKAKGILKKMLELASYLDVNTVLVIPGAVDVFFKPDAGIVSYEVVYERAKKALLEAAETAEKYKVNIGVENVWNKFLLGPLEMKNFLDEIGSDYVGAYFDVGNALRTGYPEQWIRILGKRIKKVHFKDFNTDIGSFKSFVDLLEGNVNWPEVIKAFEEIDYSDYAIAELFPYRYHPEALIYNTSKSMDLILGR